MIITNNIIKIYKGLTRSSPIIIILTSFIFGIIFRKPIGIYFSIYILLTDILTHFIKLFFKNFLYKNIKKLPLLGLGKRPNGSINCGLFIDENNPKKIATSFGMPSGHSSTAVLFALFWIIYITKNYNFDLLNILNILLLIFISSSILYSRYILGCHTIQQIIIGSILGGVYSIISYYLILK